MYMILRDSLGRRAEAILLSATQQRMRAFVEGQEDTLDFCLIDGRWISDQGLAVEIESLLASDPVTMGEVWREMRPQVAAAVS